MTVITRPTRESSRIARTDTGTPGVSAFTPVQLLRTATLFALDPDLPSILAESAEEASLAGDRPWVRLAQTSHLEVWLLGWPAGSRTLWHDHGPSKGAFVAVAGTLTERSWAGSGVLERTLSAGEGRAFGSNHIHDVVNETDEFAISVHAYSPSLREMTRYDLVDGRLHPLATERAGVDW